MKSSKANTAAHLDALARCLNNCDDPGRPMALFFDRMERGLLGESEPLPSADPTLVRALADVVGQMVGQHVAVGPRGLVTLWSKVEGHPFFHAALGIGRHLGAVFFFADTGLACVSLTDGRETKYARFRVLARAPRGVPSRN